MNDLRGGQDAEGRAGGRGPTRLGRLSSVVSNFFAGRGVYLGKRSTKFHVALYRASRGRLGRQVPGWPETEIALIDHRGARSGRRAERRASPGAGGAAPNPGRRPGASERYWWWGSLRKKFFSSE